VLHADPPDLHPRERRPPVEAHADERVAAQRRARLGAKGEWRQALAGPDPEGERDYYLERKYPSFGNLVPRDVASRNAKAVCDEGRGVGETGLSVYLDFTDAITRLGIDTIRTRYGNLFDMYRRITDDDPYKVPMRIYPAIHYTMGGLWVDYNLMSNVPGLHVLGEANFSDHGANRLGASALMQGLADGYFVIPYTIGQYLASTSLEPVSASHDAFAAASTEVAGRLDRLLAVKGKRTVRDFHRAVGAVLWDDVGMSRNDAGLKDAVGKIRTLRDEFWQNVSVPGEKTYMNQTLDYAGRVADYLEFGELLALDALHRTSRAGDTSARRARRRKAKRGATTSASRTWRRGNSAASASRPRCTRNHWCGRT
jgi:succinate dehydrogenase / fumarate reductase flavoprotein subunit